MATRDAGYYVLGLRELRAAMAVAGTESADLKEANARVSAFVASVARGMVPVKTHALQDTIRGTRQAGRAVVRAGTAKVPYAGALHYGWPSRPNLARGWRGGPIDATYYVINAAQSTETAWLEEYVADLNRIIDKIGASTP